MSWSKVMFAVASPHEIGPIEIDKVGLITMALDAQLELFHCAFDADLTRPGRFARATAQADIRQLVANRQRGLERAARRLRAHMAIGEMLSW